MNKSKLKTIDIKGRSYSTVDSRVEFFREKYAGWSIETEFPVLNIDKGVCVCKAVVKDENGRVVADGYAHEWQSKPGSMVNKTSYIENAQTSAVGRALGFVGIGINGMGIATAEEVQIAIEHQENNDFQITNQTINDVIGDEIPEHTHISTQAQNDIDAATCVQDLVSIYNAYKSTEPVEQLRAACGAKRYMLEESEIDN